MAVFFKNDCKFNGCGKTFPTLHSLIEHIEATHIDFDPKVVEEFEEQHPFGIPLSYVLRYSQSHSRQLKEVGSADVKLRLFQHASKSVGERYYSVGHQIEDEEVNSDSESSNDSWTPSKEVTTLERPKKSMKHLPSKKSRDRSLKAAYKKMYQDNQGYTLQMPSTSKATSMHSYNAPMPLPKLRNGTWTEDNNLVEEQGKMTAPEDIENYIPTIMPSSSTNNEYNAINCSQIHVNASSRWPIICPPAVKNEVTIIRPTTMQNNDDVSSTFVTYDYSAS